MVAVVLEPLVVKVVEAAQAVSKNTQPFTLLKVKYIQLLLVLAVLVLVVMTHILLKELHQV